MIEKEKCSLLSIMGDKLDVIERSLLAEYSIINKNEFILIKYKNGQKMDMTYLTQRIAECYRNNRWKFWNFITLFRIVSGNHHF